MVSGGNVTNEGLELVIKLQLPNFLPLASHVVNWHLPKVNMSWFLQLESNDEVSGMFSSEVNQSQGKDKYVLKDK